MTSSVRPTTELRAVRGIRSNLVHTGRPHRAPRLSMPWLIRGCLVLIVTFILMGTFAPLIAPHEPSSQSLTQRLSSPAFTSGGSYEYLLGTDQLGRDIFSRLIFGARVSLLIGFFGMAFGMVLGTAAGVIAGFARGLVDDFLMFLVDVQLALPFIVVALAAVAIFGTNLIVLLFLVGFAGWEGFARIARGMVLSTSQNPYVHAAEALGASRIRIVVRHILPNVIAPIIVYSTLNLTAIILLESTLSFLGIGVQPPMASWGSMIGTGRDYLHVAWWVAVFPGLAIVTVTMSISLFGDWLRDALDPTLRGR